ncbi:MAG: LptF/LptG family permease [Pirellulaceae bacterium]
MTLITRHVVAELLKTFAIALSAMTFFIVMVFLVQEALREKLTIEAIVRLIPYTIPTALSFAIPATVLFSACVVYGRMSGNNEVVAIKSSGISPSVVLIPGLVIAFLLSLLTVYLNDLAVSWGRRGIYRVILNSSAETIYTMLTAQGQFSKGRIYIDVSRVEGTDLIHPFIVRTGNDNNDGLQIRAESARILVDAENEQLIVSLKNAHITVGKEASVWFDQRDIPIPLGDVNKRSDTSVQAWNLPMRDMAQATVKQRSSLSNLRRKLAARLAAQQLGGDMVGVTHPQWGAELHQLREKIFDGYRLAAEPWRRWANGFSCLCFVMIGAPLSILFKRFDFWTNFALCFAPILFLYYPLLMFGVGQAKSGDLPGFAVWFGNIVLFGSGLLLCRRVEQS